MRSLLLIPTVFSAPKIESKPILLQEGTDSFLTKELFGANVISKKNKSLNNKDDISELVRIYDSWQQAEKKRKPIKK